MPTADELGTDPTSADPSRAGDVEGGTDGPDGDPLELAARAILVYLEDLAACRKLCLRDQASVGVCPHPHALHMVAAAERTPEGDLAHVRAAVAALPSAGRWRGGSPLEDTRAPGERTPVARYVLWEAEPLYLRVVPGEFGLVRVDLILPDHPEMPRLPLRVAASALRCLEYLLPQGVARPAPLSELAGPPPLGLWEYLRRATPENLPSSQCIWPGGAEQSPTSPSSFPPPS